MKKIVKDKTIMCEHEKLNVVARFDEELEKKVNDYIIEYGDELCNILDLSFKYTYKHIRGAISVDVLMWDTFDKQEVETSMLDLFVKTGSGGNDKLELNHDRVCIKCKKVWRLKQKVLECEKQLFEKHMKELKIKKSEWEEKKKLAEEISYEDSLI